VVLHTARHPISEQTEPGADGAPWAGGESREPLGCSHTRYALPLGPATRPRASSACATATEPSGTTSGLFTRALPVGAERSTEALEPLGSSRPGGPLRPGHDRSLGTTGVALAPTRDRGVLSALASIGMSETVLDPPQRLHLSCLFTYTVR